MIMNMSRKRSPRKKRFEFCYRPTLEWWSIPSILITMVILTESTAATPAFQNNTVNQENSVRDITKLQLEHKNEIPTINAFNDSTINYTALPEHKTHDNNVVSGINNTLVNAESNLVRFPAIITTTQNGIADKMAASEHIIKDKNKHSADNIAIDVLKDSTNNVGYVQLNNDTQLNENSTNNVESSRNTAQIVKNPTFSTAAISVPCPYKMDGSNTQNCDDIFNTSAMNVNTSETAKKHQKSLINDLNGDDYVMNDIDYMKNGVKVDFNYSKDGGINVNVAQNNSEVLNMSVHNDVKTSSGVQKNNVNNLVEISKGQGKIYVQSSVLNSVGPKNSVVDSGDKNNSTQNFDNHNNSSNNFLNHNYVRGRIDVYGGENSNVKNFVASSGVRNNSVNDFVASSGERNNSVSGFVASSGKQNSSDNDLVINSSGQNKSVDNFVTSSGNHKICNNNLLTGSGGHNNSVNNFVENSNSQNPLNKTSAHGRTNVHSYDGHKSIVKNFGASSGGPNNSVSDFVTSSDGHNNGVQSILASSSGHNKSAVMENTRVTNFQTHKNKTHVKAGEGYVLLEDEKDEYEASRNHDLDEYDRTTIRTKSPEPEANTGFFQSIQKLTGGVLESLADRIIPKSLRDILKRMQDQGTALETVRLRSKEENGGLGAYGRSLLKGLTDPLTQLVAGTGAGDKGSLDSDRGFLASLLSGVTDSMGDAFKIKVTAIYPGTLWCGDGHVAEKSGEVGLFRMTDTCCRRHDSCRLYVPAGESDYGLTNTGLFTRSHCSCDSAFYRCLKRTNTLVSLQIGTTFFSILGPQCFKREHPIVKCSRRTWITGQKCVEYEVDKTQPKIWQWFDNPTF